MKKTIILLFAVLLSFSGVQAQRHSDPWMFNHLSIGAGLGAINGASIELALPITPYLALRGGYNFFSNVKAKERFDMVYYGNARDYISHLPSRVELESKLDNSSAHVLLDIYPSCNSSFHFTTGAFFGNDDIIDVYNIDKYDAAALKEVYDFNNRLGAYSNVPADLGGQVGVMVDGTERIGVEVGDYLLEPNANGTVKGNIKVKKFRPYLGIGFGRAVPMKYRMACTFDLGVQIWGKPEVYGSHHKLTNIGLDGKGDNLVQSISKISVGPVISVKLFGRIF
ncbi:MAG: hypothetical protein IKH88_00300 [Prevotella sp.]|nr:hypothetical protein [Prevotella sp.]